MVALAAALLDPVLHALKLRHLGQIEHLPRLRLHDRRLRQIPAATLAALHRMQDRPVGILATLEMMTLMPGLAARLAARAASEAAILLHRRLGVPVRRRRLGRITGVPVKLRA
jgi:hypothetical protein